MCEREIPCDWATWSAEGQRDRGTTERDGQRRRGTQRDGEDRETHTETQEEHARATLIVAACV